MSAPLIDLMIAGAQKSGTSSLQKYVGEHPSVAIHAENEFPFFVNNDLYALGYDHSYGRLFDSAATAGTTIAAKSAVLMYSEEACNRLHQHNPQALVVLLLRNPIRRAYSAFWDARRMGLEPLETFEEALDAEPERLSESWSQWRRSAYVYHGIYAPHIVILRSLFGHERVLVYTTEDLRSSPLTVVQEVFANVGVEVDFEPDIHAKHNTAGKPKSETVARLLGQLKMSKGGAKALAAKILPRRYIRYGMRTLRSLNTEQFHPPPMLPDTYKRLHNTFYSANRDLEKLLEKDLSEWNAPQGEDIRQPNELKSI